MIDNKALSEYLTISDAARDGAGKMNMVGSRVKDENPDLATQFFVAGQALSRAAAMVERAILFASAENERE